MNAEKESLPPDATELLRIVLAALAVMMFLGTLVALSFMPVCHE